MRRPDRDPRPVELGTALDGIHTLWNPRTIARLNDYDVKAVKVARAFVWHTHDDTDELFLVVEGEVRIGLRDGGEHTVTPPAGSLFVVPRGVQHRPYSTDGASILLFEPAGTVNVGDRHDDLPEHITATAGRPTA